MLHPMILHEHLIPFVFYVGLINAYSVGQIITAHLTQSRFPFGNVLVLPLLWGVLDSTGPLLQQWFARFGARLGLDAAALRWVGWPSALGGDVYQVAFVFMCVGLGAGVYGSFVVDVIVSICDYLDIWCLTIKHPYVEAAAQESGGGNGHVNGKVKPM
jgi:ethanolaminephosphotransferase